MSGKKCFCGAEAVRCSGVLRLKKVGGQKLICSHCRGYGGKLSNGHKVGNRCEAQICVDSGKPLLACPKRKPLPGVTSKNRCYCGGKIWLCGGRLLLAADRRRLECTRCGALVETHNGDRPGDVCTKVICASSRQIAAVCPKRSQLKKERRQARRNIGKYILA